ncbi:hypothetical protein [Saliphagus sp. LR7]|uniref:hypothetical protein n=1 Tax=Saliphagus sp. LR7 TaxID=2282654 RepID=UPI001300654B|nr:hypothetical protein [Saliphagus sp. LR7]
MEFKELSRSEGVEIEVKGKGERKIATFLKEYDSQLTIVLAFLALIIGIATLYFPELRWVRLTLSFLTLIAAIVTFVRVAEGSGSVRVESSAKGRVVDSTPVEGEK